LAREKWIAAVPESLALLISLPATQSAIIIGLALCLPLAGGALDRAAAFLLMLISVALFIICGTPLSLVILAWLFFCHLVVPGAPLLSLAARGREAPAGDWFMPRTVISYTRVVAVVLWLFAALWLFRFVDGPAMPLAIVELLAAMALLHLLVRNPASPAATPQDTNIRLFYDGNCGLCHRAVRIVLGEDTSGEAFRFAPLGGDAYTTELSNEQRAGLPDSMVVISPSGKILTRSDSVIFIGRRLGGLWRMGASALAIIPRAIRDFAYDGIAATRLRFFSKPPDSCPLLPEPLHGRFDS
jgi:predicted DCC family thiol-disulfide oxidoreductase YuxK